MFSPSSYRNSQTDPTPQACEVTEVLLTHCKSSKTKVTQSTSTQVCGQHSYKNMFRTMSPFNTWCCRISSLSGKRCRFWILLVMLIFFIYKENYGASCDVLTNVLFAEKAIPKPVITEPVSLFMFFSVSTQNLFEAEQKLVCMHMYWSHINGTRFGGKNIATFAFLH